MENASRALIIAAGILIAMMVAGILVYSRVEWGDYQESQERVKLQEQTTEFNQRFESYNKKVITGFQMISLTNLVTDYNSSVKETGYKDIELKVKWYDLKENQTPSHSLKDLSLDEIAKFGTGSKTDKEKKEFKEKYFTCVSINYDNASGRVIAMNYKEITKK